MNEGTYSTVFKESGEIINVFHDASLLVMYLKHFSNNVNYYF